MTEQKARVEAQGQYALDRILERLTVAESRVAELEAALRIIADSGDIHKRMPVLPINVLELQQIARAALQPRTAVRK